MNTVPLSRNLHFNYPTQTRTLSELQIVRQRSERFRAVWSPPEKSEIWYFEKWGEGKTWESRGKRRFSSHFLQHCLPHFSREQRIKLSYLALLVSWWMVAGWENFIPLSKLLIPRALKSPWQPSFGCHATLRPKERCVTSKRLLRRRLRAPHFICPSTHF